MEHTRDVLTSQLILRPTQDGPIVPARIQTVDQLWTRWNTLSKEDLHPILWTFSSKTITCEVGPVVRNLDSGNVLSSELELKVQWNWSWSSGFERTVQLIDAISPWATPYTNFWWSAQTGLSGTKYWIWNHLFQFWLQASHLIYSVTRKFWAHGLPFYFARGRSVVSCLFFVCDFCNHIEKCHSQCTCFW